MLRLAKRVNSLKPSVTMDISDQARKLRTEGHDVISLAAGEPDFDTPETIRDAAVDALSRGITRYTPAPGFLALREAIAQKVTRQNGFPVKPEEVLVAVGAKNAIYLALQCLAEPGDAILVPTPAWVSYQPMIELAGASILPLPTYEEDGFRINVDRWKNLAIPDNARGIILNTPNNPTGVAYPKEDLVRLAGWALQRNLWILSDEIYEDILYDGATHTSVASLSEEMRSHTITVGGFSKSYCMTGWRLGWAIAEAGLIKKMSALQSQCNSHATSFVQWAGITAAQTPPDVIQGMVKEFDRRRRFCCEQLDRHKGKLSYVRPTGAFYLFVNLSPWLKERGMNDVEFCTTFLKDHYVGMVPGSAFGMNNFVRISYATSMENLEKAFARLDAYLNS